MKGDAFGDESHANIHRTAALGGADRGNTDPDDSEVVELHRRDYFRGKEDMSMLHWALTFLVIALIAGLLGLSGVAGAATQISWVLFVVFLILFLVGLVMGRRPPA